MSQEMSVFGSRTEAFKRPKARVSLSELKLTSLLCPGFSHSATDPSSARPSEAVRSGSCSLRLPPCPATLGSWLLTAPNFALSGLPEWNTPLPSTHMTHCLTSSQSLLERHPVGLALIIPFQIHPGHPTLLLWGPSSSLRLSVPCPKCLGTEVFWFGKHLHMHEMSWG